MKRNNRIFRIIALAVTLSVLMTSVVITGVAANSVYGDYEYELNEDGTVTITKYNGSDAHVEIPSEIGGRKVTVIGHHAFEKNDTLESLVIPYGVTELKTDAFAGCGRLADVDIPKSVTRLGEGAFFSCNSLKYVVVPGAVTYMESNVFAWCTNLIGAAFGTGTEVLGSDTFFWCFALEEVILPNTVKEIGSLAFCDCSKLKELWLPLELEHIGANAFDGCSTTLYYPGTEEMLSKVTAHKDNKDLFELPIYLVETILDVPWDAWYYPSVEFVVSSGLMKGTSNTLFEPEIPMNRAMLVTVLWRLEGEPIARGYTPFDDISEDWYKEAVVWAYKKNIIKGTSDTEFSPYENVTRQQIATIMHRYAEYKGIDTSESADITGFPDFADVDDYAKESLTWANAVGLITGSDEGGVYYLLPDDSATRAQVATILMRYCEKYLTE